MLQIMASRALAALARPLAAQGGALGALEAAVAAATGSAGSRAASSAAAAAAAAESSSSSTPGPPSTSGRARLGPPSAAPYAAEYELTLVVKGFELRYVKQASTVIRDLLLLCFAPKSAAVLPEGLACGRDQLASLRRTPVALALPLGDRALRTRRTLFTVIRGPHVHKASREQFQRLVHARVIRFPTNSHAELQWFLDALRSYDFTAVEIRAAVASRSFLTPPPLDGDGDGHATDAGRPLLADHFARFPHLFPAAAAAAGGGGGGGADSFEAVAGAARRELLAERLRLQGTEEYSKWLRGLDAAGLAAAADAAAAAAGGGPGGLAALGRAVAAEYAAAGAAAGGQPLETALAAAAQRVLLDPGLVPELTGCVCRRGCADGGKGVEE
jgi:ribosomal protein S10